MPLPIITGVYRVAIEWTDPAYIRRAVSVMHFYNPAGTALNVWNDLDAHVSANMWTHANTSTAATSVAITPLDGTTNTSFHTPSGAKWAGAIPGGFDSIPQVCVIVKWLTATRGRSHRGRTYLPFISESQAVNGAFNATNVNVMQTAWSTFLSGIGLAGTTPTVASYKLSTSSLVTSFVVEPQLATQRRRQPRP
jgi:hypothetical protein